MPAMTDVLTLDARRPDPAGIARAAALLRAGALVAFPTETVYGLGAHALDAEAVRKIFAAKGRPADDPLIVHIHDDSQLPLLAADVPPAVARIASRFWPGPLTIVLPRAERVPPEVTAGLDTVAIRVPAHPIAHALLAAAGIPVAAPSANLFSRPSPTRAGHVLHDLGGRIDLVIDGGPTDVGVESTVLDLTEGTPTILRPGAITLEMIRAILPDARMRDGASRSEPGIKSPGLLAKHYSPRAPLTLYEGPPEAVAARIAADVGHALAAGQRVGLLAVNEDSLAAGSIDGLHVEKLGSERDVSAIAANLYHALRLLDAAQVDLIVARTFGGDAGLAVTISDRLRRAAAGRVVFVDN
jgi:L-threonylcarbamoyladenylate synthase